MNILAIGNSFSQDATRYLHSIAKCGGEDITVVNLYIGGCSLSRHYRNMLTKDRAYSLEFNGEATGFFISLEEALLSRDWDYITLQQASHLSITYDTYQPYIGELSSYVRMCCPKAKLLIHETWAYEEGTERLSKLGYSTPDEMYGRLHEAYEYAAHEINAYSVIPSGTLMNKLASSGLKIHRDGFHMSYGIGRYALGLLWYKCLTCNDVLKNTFSSFDEPIDDATTETIKNIVSGI